MGASGAQNDKTVALLTAELVARWRTARAAGTSEGFVVRTAAGLAGYPTE